MAVVIFILILLNLPFDSCAHVVCTRPLQSPFYPSTTVALVLPWAALVPPFTGEKTGSEACLGGLRSLSWSEPGAHLDPEA